MAKGNGPEGALLRKCIFEHALSPKGCIDKAMQARQNTAKPVEKEYRHVFWTRGCMDKYLASEGYIDKEFPLPMQPFPAKEKKEGYIDKGPS